MKTPGTDWEKFNLRGETKDHYTMTMQLQYASSNPASLSKLQNECENAIMTFNAFLGFNF